MGKVHGSLARAGKVKSQTPKVEKQADKKVPVVGRAKKRFQYNKRYAAVKAGTDPKRIKANSQLQQQAAKLQKEEQAARIAAKKK
ncbi:ribosomal protein S30 [Acrasis kona]|uniref:Ribosomal protein S30 n=1 Tax=Acrasis kona TaxID=1008807 RepID=A0AAW2Z4U5_9EUKA